MSHACKHTDRPKLHRASRPVCTVQADGDPDRAQSALQEVAECVVLSEVLLTPETLASVLQSHADSIGKPQK